MKDVGIVGLDTSHSKAFASVLASQERAGLTAVWDDRTIRGDEYVRQFCAEHGATEYDTTESMIPEVDAAMILTVDWDTHCELAIPFLEAGVPTLIDKPIAGRLRDIDILEEATNGTPFFGGSALPYHPELVSLTRHPDDEAVYCAGYDDTFYYGCHLADAVRRVADADWSVVRPASDPGQTVDVHFENDTFATVRLDGPDGGGNFVLLSAGGNADAAIVGSNGPDRQAMYEGYVDAYLDTVDGCVDESHRVFDGARLLLAIHAALSENQPITADSGKLRDIHIAGDTFVESYDPYY